MNQSSDRKETRIARLCAFLRLHTFLPITCRQITRHERRSEEIVKLWENPQWQVRKQVVHDFSQAVSGDYMQKTTLDVDLQEILSSVDIKIGDRIAIPIEWRPKGLVMSLNASVDENTSHVISRVICQRAALIILESGALATLNSTSNEANSDKSILGGLPQCIENILEALIKMPPREILKRKLDAMSIMRHLRYLTLSHDKTKGCAQECVGDLQWRTLQEDSLFMSILAAFALGYVRAVEVPVTSNGITILKTKEVVASNPFEQVRSSVPDALWLQADPANLTIRRTINVDIPADANMIKCLPPNYAHFAPTPPGETIVFSSPTPPATQADPVRLKVQGDGAWAHHKQGIQDDGKVRGSRIEIRKGMVDVVARRANLIFPGLILTSLGLLSQVYMLIHMLISLPVNRNDNNNNSPTQGGAGIEAPLIGGIAIIVPLIVLAYASTSRHVLLSRLLEPYRLILIWGTLLQLVAIGLAALFEQVAIGLLNLGLTTSVIILIVFLDATKQKHNSYYAQRLRCLRNFRNKINQLPLWGAISTLAPVVTAIGQICFDVPIEYILIIIAVRFGLNILSLVYVKRYFSIGSRRLNINWLIMLAGVEAGCLAFVAPTSTLASQYWPITICLIVLQIVYLAARIFSIYILSYTVHGKNCGKCKDPKMSCTTKTGSQLIKIPDKGKDDYKAFGIIDVKDLFTDDVSADITRSQSAVEGDCE